MIELLRYKNNQKYVFWDYETCSLHLQSPNNKPWQLGILVCEGEKIIEEHDLYIWWEDLRVSPGAARVTRFDYNKYKSLARPAQECLNIIEKYIYNPEYISILHNSLSFDIFIHNIYRNLLNKSSDYSYIYRMIDTNSVARGIKLNEKFSGELGEEFLIYQFRMANAIIKGLKTNLTLLGKENKIDVDFDNLHSGINDVKLLYQVWNKYIKWNLEI